MTNFFLTENIRVDNRYENLQLDSDRAATSQKNYVTVIDLATLIALLNFKDRFGYEEVSINTAQKVETPDLGTPVYSLRRAPELLTSPLATQQLQENLSELISSLPDSSCFAISADGEQLFEFQKQLPLNLGCPENYHRLRSTCTVRA